MTWLLDNKPLERAPQDSQGFVYSITNLAYNRRYIGKKNFWSTRSLPPLKGRKRKRRVTVETDWQSYWGSNAQLLRDVHTLGVDAFRRDILYVCRTKSDMSYIETRTQFQLNVLASDEYYNEFIGCRINGKNLSIL